MQKQEAITILENTFNNAFDENNFTLFVKNLLNDLDTTKYNHYSGNYIKDAFRKHIKQYKRIGKYTDPNGDAMDVLIVEVTDQYNLDHARSSLRNFVITHLDNFDKDYALVAFFSESDARADWRFSFVKMEYKTEVKNGKVKQNKELTPAKRYSFLVGEHERAHTAKKQLLPLLENIYNNPTIEELEGAFSIETVTDEFFEQYKALFVSLTEQFGQNHQLKRELAASGIEIPRFTKKLLGQIVFLYFLQKKGWMGVAKDQKWGTGEKRFLQKLYDEANDSGKNFFGDFLQILFYEALAQKHNDEGVHGYFAKLKCKVPFLNGGLFEADYDWENDHITIPNELFRNKDKMGKNGDIGSGVLDVFDRYNFTIKEDEPLEKEVAVDPEMLGKVFENMLEITERKSKGAFYTPREIVHYMCQESLIHYLDNAVNTYSKTYQELGNPQISMFGNEVNKGQQSLILEQDHILIQKEDIETFIRKGFFTLENDQRILKKGNETRTYQFKLPESIRINANLLDTKLAEIRICDPAIGSGAFPVGMLHEIVNARLVLRPHLKNQAKPVNPENPDSDKYAYQLKRHTIQECIYGVDIDASAIDIARLRLWLSLVVDEEDLDTIEALPNLDYKIVCGNSLIGFPENWDSPSFGKLEALKKEFFEEIDSEKKKILKQQIDNKLQERLDTSEKIFGYKIDFDFKLFFSEVWHNRGGFDIVIGNPPFVDIKQLPASFVRFLFNHFNTTQNRINLYSIFIEKGLRLCHEEGTLIFINPNSMLLNSSYKKLRLQIIKGLIQVVKLPDKVFKEAIVETIIIQIGKPETSIPVIGAYYKKDEIINFDSLKLTSFDRTLWINDPDIRISIFTSPQRLKIIEKISQGKLNLDSVYDFCLGITPYDKYKGHSQDQIDDRVFHSKTKIDNLYVPLISGSNINRFYVEENIIDEYLFYGEWLGAPRQKKFFTNPRVIVRQIVSGKPLRIYAGYTNKELYHTQIGFSIISTEDSPFSTKVLCSYLNSAILNFYHKFKFLDIEKNTFQKILIENCKAFPVPYIDQFGITKVERLFEYLQYLGSYKSLKLLFSFFDEINDAIFYELFFPDKIQSANKEILKHLGELKPITENMSDEQKISIIQSEFERLYDPNHPVRNNVETLDSVEEVRIIKGALK